MGLPHNELTTFGLPSEAWLRRVSSTKKNFSASIWNHLHKPKESHNRSQEFGAGWCSDSWPTRLQECRREPRQYCRVERLRFWWLLSSGSRFCSLGQAGFRGPK